MKWKWETLLTILFVALLVVVIGFGLVRWGEIRAETRLAAALTPTATPTPVPTPAWHGWRQVNPSELPAPQGYPGWIRKADGQQSDGIPREWEIEVGPEQIVLIFGDEAQIPPIGKVGGQWTNHGVSGCYLVVAKGPIVWDTQPSEGEYPPIQVPLRSAWDLHDVEELANPLIWAAQKTQDLKASYPNTCGNDVEIWGYIP